MGFFGLARRSGTVVLAALVMAGAANASEEEAAAALNQALASGAAMLAIVETVDGPESLERESGAISAAAERARVDMAAVGQFAEDLESSEALRVEFEPKLQAYYTRRNEIGARLEQQLDPATFEDLTVLMEGSR
jgi:hypothetical protein